MGGARRQRFARPLFVILLAALPAATAAVAVAQTEPAAQVDAVFARWASRESPGCAVGVASAGRQILARAYGMADLEQERANTPETVFEAGSVSKQFTAAAVLLLAQEGKLSLDDPVRKYVPDVPDYGEPITIRHLLAHTSGLRDWGTLAAIAGWPRTTRAHSHAHVLDILRRQQALNFPPGSQYSYSNSGYNLAAILVAVVSGQPFAEFTRARMFEPLGMSHTQWRDDFTRIVKRRATAYSPSRDKGWRLDMPFEHVHGNGGLLTTVGDLLAWNENFVHARVGGPALVAEQLRRARLSGGREIHYAAGLRVSTWRGLQEVWHSGDTAGYRAFLARFPERRLSVAVLCNAGNAEAGALAHAVAGIFLGDALEPVPKVKPIALGPEALSRRAGVYRSERTGAALRLEVDGDRLRIDVEGRPTMWALSGTSFLLDGVDARAEFDLDAAGAVTALRVESATDEPERFVRTPQATPDGAALAAYVGRYRSEEAETEFFAEAQDGRLLLLQRPDRVFPLLPAWADAFTTAFGTVTFRRNVAGQVDALSLTVPRVYDLRFTRVAPAP